MAIWQFSLQIVSREDIESKYQSIPEIIGSDDVELLTGWKQNLPLNIIYSALNKELEGILLINNRLYQPDPKVLLKEIKKSAAEKFLENPTKYLNDLDEES
jgi:hypothetical protein